METLDLSYCTCITHLYIDLNNVCDVIIHGCKLLKSLYVQSAKLRQLNCCMLTQLSLLLFQDCFSLSHIDVTGCHAMHTLCTGHSFKSVMQKERLFSKYLYPLLPYSHELCPVSFVWVEELLNDSDVCYSNSKEELVVNRKLLQDAIFTQNTALALEHHCDILGYTLSDG